MRRELNLRPGLAIAIFAVAFAGCNDNGETGSTASGTTARPPSGDRPDTGRRPEPTPPTPGDPAECRALADQLAGCGQCQAEIDAFRVCRDEASVGSGGDPSVRPCEAEHHAEIACHEACRPLAEQLRERCPPPPPPGELRVTCNLLGAALATCHGDRPPPPPQCEPRHRHRQGRPGGEQRPPEGRDDPAGVQPGESDPADHEPGDGPPGDGAPGDRAPSDRDPPPPPRDGEHGDRPEPPDGREPPTGPGDPGSGRDHERCASIERAIGELCGPGERR